MTALTIATRSSVLVPIATVGGECEARLRADLAASGIDRRHQIVDVAPTGIVDELAAAGLRVVSMGRPAADDPVLFELAAAAAVCAADCMTRP